MRRPIARGIPHSPDRQSALHERRVLSSRWIAGFGRRSPSVSQATSPDPNGVPVRGLTGLLSFRSYDIRSSSTDTGRHAMNDHPADLDRTNADVPDEEVLYEEIPDAELEIAAMGGRPGVDTGNGKPTSTPQCCSYG